MPVLVYLITGFLDSGKTTLIKNSLEDPDFTSDNNKTLIIQLEDGEVSFSNDWLKSHNSSCVILDSAKDLTYKKMQELNKLYKPEQVFIEFNGLESPSDFLSFKLIKEWALVQILTTIDSSTFISYLNNMKSYMFEIIRYTQTVIFNRINKNISKVQLRNNIKAINQSAQIIYINKNNEPEQFDITDMPFDINKNIIDIPNDYYGLWYMDAIDNMQRYNGKDIILRGKYLDNIPNLNHSFIFGRMSMVCCADDMQPVALTVTGVNVEQMKLHDWYEVEGTLKMIDRGNENFTLILYAKSIKTYPTPKNELVDFS